MCLEESEQGHYFIGHGFCLFSYASLQSAWKNVSKRIKIMKIFCSVTCDTLRPPHNGSKYFKKTHFLFASLVNIFPYSKILNDQSRGQLSKSQLPPTIDK